MGERQTVMPDASTVPAVYDRVLEVVRQIPRGQVATYGQIAMIVGNCTPRMVGYCMASLDPDSDVPWQRVINAQGRISPAGRATAQCASDNSSSPRASSSATPTASASANSAGSTPTDPEVNDHA